MPDAVIRADALALAGFALYFLAHAVLRTALGGALEIDEAEMLVLAQDWRLGYGPQFPLYNWLQVAAFGLLGEGTAALAFLKNAVLWLATAGLYLGLRRGVGPPQALAGTLALALLPNVVWEFQRASTHSIALLACVTWTIFAVLGLLQRGRWGDYLLFGVVLGLGGLSKANYWLVPLVLLLACVRLPGPPQRLRAGGLALSGAVAALIVAWPYLWMLDNPGLASASTGKMYRADWGPDWGLPPGIEGLIESLGGVVAGLLPVALALFLLRRAGRGQPAVGPDWPATLLLRAGAIGLAISLAGVVLAGVSEVQARWLVPVLLLLASGGLLHVARRASVRALRGLTLAAAGLATITLAGMAELRLNGPSTGGLQFAALAELTDDLAPDLVLADFHLGGNLRLLRPDLAVMPPLLLAPPEGADPRRVLILSKGKTPPDPAQAFAQRGLAVPAATADAVPGTLDLRYRNADKPRFALGYLFLPAVTVQPPP